MAGLVAGVASLLFVGVTWLLDALWTQAAAKALDGETVSDLTSPWWKE